MTQPENRTVEELAEDDIRLVIGQLRENGYHDWPDILERALGFLAAAKEHGLVIGEEGLDAAWKEAEAALPEGWDLGITRSSNPTDYDAWARYQEDEADPETITLHDETGDTPAAALHALAERLRR